MALVSGAGLTLDVSYQNTPINTLTETVTLPEQFDQTRQLLLKGEYLNVSEGRHVTHILSRSIHAVSSAKNRDTRFAKMVNKLRSGRWLGATGKPITAVVNIGVGGSDLGPNMGSFALKEFADDAALNELDVHFVSSMDGGQLYAVLPIIDPETTLFIIASKSFGTIDTFANVDTVREWIKPQLTEQQWLQDHVIGVSSNAVKMNDYGIPPAHQLTFGEGVGGRFSLWSAIGLPIALSCGLRTFERMLSGARAMDEHFGSAPAAENIPLLMAMYGIYNRQHLGINNLAILPYDGRLRMLPNYLQQLDMESNGKQATADNQAINYATGPIIWGGFGPNGQHAFFQHLHQGYDEFAADFVLVLKRQAPGFNAQVANKLADQQQLSVANCLAHRQLMKFGSDNPESPRDHYPGGHPSSLLFMDELTPETFGELIAAYEHKVFVQGVYWQLNSFDQPGVELGKKCAVDILQALQSGAKTSYDESTVTMIKKARGDE
ncbi:glucose-6-phosphate isomerase [Idiomarina seosinensis]|uniref:Glucose-6-phosphate isomerase n=1 Tax=Idiomarina seosinensis TaxID=281739 RepID=A0A432ZGM2_9GAMM|nr:glucose-6-phosphate isomerase [Idiomarina seosinensis]RUO76970.1 glucose-6-phosphate isomerase [Idiomarina seosinensis]